MIVNIGCHSLSRWCAVGGNANNGANDGFGYVNANNVWTNTNVNYGSRNYLENKFTNIGNETFTSWQKITV